MRPELTCGGLNLSCLLILVHLALAARAIRSHIPHSSITLPCVSTLFQTIINTFVPADRYLAAASSSKAIPSASADHHIRFTH